MQAIRYAMAVLYLAAALGSPAQWTDGITEIGPEEEAIYFMEALQEGGWQYAANYCTDPDEFEKWTPPFVTKYLVFPSVDDIQVKQALVSGDTAEVTLSLTAADFDAVGKDGYALGEDFLYSLCLSDEYATENVLNDENLMWLINGSGELMAQLKQHRKQYEIPFALKNVQGEWLIDLTATKELRQPDALAVAPLSYGTLSQDYAQRRYYVKDALYSKALSYPEDIPWGDWLQSITVDAVFAALGQPVWNVWLRLQAQGDAEGLYGFSAGDSGAQCAPGLVEYAEFGVSVRDRRWATIGGQACGVLEMHIPGAGSGPLGDIALQCRRRMNIWTPLYFEEGLIFSLSGVPYDSGYPAGGVSFEINRFLRFGEDNGMSKDDTLGQWMANELAHQDSAYYVFQDMPEGIGDLPVINSEYALYQLEGTVKKEQGDFGVYDVTFALQTPADGVWVEAFEQCSSECDAIDSFDLMGAESTAREKLQGGFDLLVLVRMEGRPEQELAALLSSLKLSATFSCEEWNFCYEQHGTTRRIGPRTTLPVDLSNMEYWPGTLFDLPRAERIYADEQ